jgi:hypothetical protein
MRGLIGVLVLVVGCHAARGAAAIPEGATTLRADSAQYAVRVNGPLYEAAIGFLFINNSGHTLSANYCRVPPPPALEKQRADGGWVHAYSPVVLLCLTLPPFRVANGGTYRGTLALAAGRPGTNFFPKFEADSVPGIYRLRWELRTGADPDDRASPMVVATSPPFRLVKP